jgi:hypothetical protein
MANDLIIREIITGKAIQQDGWQVTDEHMREYKSSCVSSTPLTAFPEQLERPGNLGRVRMVK